MQPQVSPCRTQGGLSSGPTTPAHYLYCLFPLDLLSLSQHPLAAPSSVEAVHALTEHSAWARCDCAAKQETGDSKRRSLPGWTQDDRERFAPRAAERCGRCPQGYHGAGSAMQRLPGTVSSSKSRRRGLDYPTEHQHGFGSGGWFEVHTPGTNTMYPSVLLSIRPVLFRASLGPQRGRGTCSPTVSSLLGVIDYRLVVGMISCVYRYTQGVAPLLSDGFKSHPPSSHLKQETFSGCEKDRRNVVLVLLETELLGSLA